jgi:hypothetical protein
MLNETVHDDSVVVEGKSEKDSTQAIPKVDIQSAVVGVFDTHRQAEGAIKTLQENEFPLRRLSIIGKGYHTEERPLGFYTAGDRIKTWGGTGLFWGSLWGLLFGAAFFWIPGLGSIAVAGPFVHMLATTVEGAVVVGGVSALGAAMVSLGMPKKEVIKYESHIRADKYLVIAHGAPVEVERAHTLMEQAQAVETAVVEA